jgi:peptide/nickel transport system substrate-binding protein
MTIAVRPRVQLLTWDKFRNLNPTKSATRGDCAFAIYNAIVPPASGKTSLVTTDSAPENLFPLTSSSAYTGIAVGYLADPCIGMTPSAVLFPDLCTYVPSLANKHLIRNADGTVVTDYQLRKGLKWSDGKPLTIDDMIFAVALHLNDAIRAVSRDPYDKIARMQKLDDYTVRVYWKEWTPYVVTGLDVYPKHILGPIFDKNPADINTCAFNDNPVYCGPYVIKDAVKGQYTTMIANSDYFGGEPVIHQITEMYNIDSTNSLLINLLTGQIDVASEALTLDMAEQFEKRMGTSFNVYYNKGTVWGEMNTNCASAWFKDVRVRQAFYYAIDRNLLTRKAMVGQEAVMSPISSGSVFFKPVLARYAYSPEKANELLDAAGWKWNDKHTQRILPDGEPAILKVPFSAGATFRDRECVIMQPMLAKVGITLQEDPTDFDKMMDSEVAGDYTVTLRGGDGDNYDVYQSVLQWRSDQIPTEKNGMRGYNIQRYSNPEMDKWVAVAQKSTDAKSLSEAYGHIQDIFAEDVPNLFLEQRMYPDIVRKGLKGYDHFFSSSVYANWNVAWWYWWKS